MKTERMETIIDGLREGRPIADIAAELGVCITRVNQIIRRTPTIDRRLVARYRAANRARRSLKFTDVALVMMLERGMFDSVREIAAELGVAEATVRRRIKRSFALSQAMAARREIVQKISTGKAKRSRNVAAISAGIRDGKTNAQIGQSLGVTSGLIARIIAEQPALRTLRKTLRATEIALMRADYEEGVSVPEISAKYNAKLSTVYFRIHGTSKGRKS